MNPEKILKHAETRLQINPETAPQDWVELYRNFLKIEMHRIYMAHRFGAEGLQIARDRSYLMDVVIRHIYEHIFKNHPTLHLSIVALGGFGRQELNPHSDIDILFLIPKPNPETDDRVKKFLYLLWDIGLKVGQSVRTIRDAIEEGRKDFKSRTSMMEARWIIGHEDDYLEFERQLQNQCLSKDIPQYIQKKMEEIQIRHEKYRATVYLQEPNIKEGVGGLRDLNSCLWIFRALKGYRSFEELFQHHILSGPDYKIMGRVLQFMHRVRNELHFLSGRSFDILSLPLQPKIAENLGYRNTKNTKASEEFMKDYYLHARNSQQLTQTLISHEEVNLQLKLRFPHRYVERHGFLFTSDEIFLGKNQNLFFENPIKMFEVFLYGVQGSYRISQSLSQQIRQHLHLIDRKVQTSPEVRECFLSIMKQEGSIIQSLRAMHDCGLLGKYIPEFGKATCLVQHDMYHQYTLDEHTLRAVGFLDELKSSQNPRLAAFCHVMKEVQDLDVAFLAMFFHDIGKIEGKDHSTKGARLVAEILARMQYPPAKIARVRKQVEYHLLMSHLSQRRDLTEEKVIIDFAQKIADVGDLRILLLLTYSDWRATSDNVWNEWRESLLWELYYRTKRYLEEKVILLPSEIESMKTSHIELLSQKGINSERVREHLDMMPVSYLQSYMPDTILNHLKIIQEIEHQDPKVLWNYDEKTNSTDMTLCTRDHIGLFSEITGIIAVNEVNILSANIFSRKDGIILDKFSLDNQPEKHLLSERIRQRIERNLESVLHKEKSVPDLFQEYRISRNSPQPRRKTPIVVFDNETSLATTILEIQADDEIGFLYRVTRTLSRLGLNIHFAKIATEKAQVFDVFYITDCENKKITYENVLKVIRDEIEKAFLKPIEEV